MRGRYQAAALLLSAVLLCGAGGCRTAKNPQETDGTTPAETTADILCTALDTPPIPLTYGDTSAYRIVYDQAKHSLMYPLALAIQSAVMEQTGAWLRIVQRESAPAEHEIVLGNLDRAACDTAYSGLSPGDYAVQAVGSRIVIAAYTAETMKTAAALFVTACLTETEEGLAVQSHRWTDMREKTIGADLAQYTLVVPAGDTYAAELAGTLRDRIETALGVRLQVVPDSTPAAPLEILVGKTERAEGAAVFDTLAEYTCAVAGVDRKIVVAANTRAALWLGVETLCSSTVSGMRAAGYFDWPADCTQVSSCIDTADPQTLAAGADLRIMSFNILHEGWGELPLTARGELLTLNMAYYRPDVIGLQEVSAGWHERLDALLCNGAYIYEKACTYTDYGALSMTMFAYNTQTVRLIEETCVKAHEAETNIRVLAVALFERIADGKRFVVMNIHPSPDNHADRAVSIAWTIQRIGEFAEKYRAYPRLITGDFNAKEPSADYAKFLADPSPFRVDCKFADGVQLLRDITSSAPVGAMPSGRPESLDHILTDGAVQVLLYNTVIDNRSREISDHCPVYADLRLP